MNKKLFIICSILIVSGIIILSFGIINSLNSISKIIELNDIEDESFNEKFNAYEAKNYFFKEGKYDIYYLVDSSSNNDYTWFKKNFITIHDPNLEPVEIDNRVLSDTFSVADREYEKYGFFEAEVEGDYKVTANESCTLLIIEHGVITKGIFSMLFSISLIIVGIILIAVGSIVLVFFYIFDEKSEKKET